MHELPAADRRLDTHRLTGDLTNLHDHIKQLIHIPGFRVAVWGNRIFAKWNAANPGNFLSHFCRWEDTTFTGLGTLRELDFEGSNMLQRGHFFELLWVKLALPSRTPYLAVPI